MAEVLGLGICHRCGEPTPDAYCGRDCREQARSDALAGVAWTPPDAWREAVTTINLRERKAPRVTAPKSKP